MVYIVNTLYAENTQFQYEKRLDDGNDLQYTLFYTVNCM